MTEHTPSYQCPQCKRELTGQHNFCPYCGYVLQSRAGTSSPPPAAGEEQPLVAPPTPARMPKPTASAPVAKRVAKTKTTNRFRFIDRKVLFGWLGVLDIPIILILGFLLIRLWSPAVPPPTLACDDLDPGGFSPARFERGLGGELDENTLFRADTKYLIQNTLVVPQNRRLLIEPGAVLEFEEGSGIEVRGSFYACGSSRDPITFTSDRGTPGSWQGIQFINADESSTLSHVLIQFAGDRAIYIEDSKPDLVDVKISRSSAFPISVDGNGLSEVMVDVDLETNPFVGIEIRGGAAANRQNVTWPNHGLVYVVSGLVEIGSNTTLEIESGAIVKFWQPSRGSAPGLRIRGLLKAEDVQFTSVYDSRNNVGGVTYVEAQDPAAGDWAGITFHESSGKSYLRRVLVQYAGRDQGAISMQNSAPELTNVTIRDSAWYPLSADANSFPELENVTLADNDPGDALEIRGGSAISGRQAYTWRVLGDNEQIVRVIRGVVTVEPEATLTIQPGVIVKFEPRSRLVIQGTLNAIGGNADREKIVFTSLRDGEYGGNTDKNTGPQDRRDWDGILFDGADDSSILQNSIIRYAAIGVNDGSPQLIDNLIMDSETAAIILSPNAAPTLQGNQLRQNDLDGVAIGGGRMERDQIWTRLGDGNEQLVRVLTGAITINDGATLQIESGVVVKADKDGKLVVNGGLRVLGESNAPVIFTSLHDDSAGGDTNQKLQEARAGDWAGLEIASSAHISFAHAQIRYARTGLLLRDGVAPAIAGSLRISDGQNALWCDGRAEMPATLVTEGNEDNYRQCPTQ
jgi:hypothetical protein